MYKPSEYNCHHCDKPFTFPQEIYTIRNLMVEGDISPEKQIRWRWVRDSDNIESIDYYFHRECFEEVAGLRYIGKRLL